MSVPSVVWMDSSIYVVCMICLRFVATCTVSSRAQGPVRTRIARLRHPRATVKCRALCVMHCVTYCVYADLFMVARYSPGDGARVRAFVNDPQIC